MEVTTDDGSNDDGFLLKTVNLSGLSEKIDDKKCVSGVAAAQQNNSTTLLPPVSLSYIPKRTSQRDFMNIVTAVLSPLSFSSAMRMNQKSWYSESASFGGLEMDAINNETKVGINEQSYVLPSITLKGPKNHGKDITWNNQHKSIMDHIPKSSENTVYPDVLNDESESLCISPPHLNPDIFTKLLETPRKFKWFENFEQDQENAWNCSRQTPNSLSYTNYDKKRYIMLSDKNTHDETLIGRITDTLERPQILDSNISQDNQDQVNITTKTPSNYVNLDDLNDNDISSCTSSFLSGNSDTLTSEEIEEKRNESSFEALLPNELNSLTLDKMDILEEANPTSSDISRSHYFHGIPLSKKESCSSLDDVKELFHKYNDRVDLSHMEEICLASKLCPLWKQPLYNCISTSVSNFIDFNEFTNWWKKFKENAYDEASRFVYILTNGSRNFLVADDFEALMQDLIETLPSLSFLKEANTFHQAYIKTVTARIFWTVCHSWKKHISIAELRSSNLLKAIRALEKVDVNEEREFFSYEHFYVIYYNFYLLDKDKKNYLTPFDLSLYSNCALTNLVVERIFSGAVSPNCSMKQIMDYIAFVNFLLAEVDKCHPKSIEYWFRIMDLNGDGRISFDEMERFYNEIVANVVNMDVDTLIFNNLVNMLKDMISPHSPTYFTLSDLKRSPSLARYFFDTFTNWMKHIAQESCKPVRRNVANSRFSDWNRYCKSKYEILRAKLSNNDKETLVNEILNSLNLVMKKEIISAIFQSCELFFF
ncbi:EF-hand domain pair family protein [Acanthocheilonema viteae]